MCCRYVILQSHAKHVKGGAPATRYGAAVQKQKRELEQDWERNRTWLVARLWGREVLNWTCLVGQKRSRLVLCAIGIRTYFLFEFSIARCGSNKIRSPSAKRFDVWLAGTQSKKSTKVRTLFYVGQSVAIETHSSIGWDLVRARLQARLVLKLVGTWYDKVWKRDSNS